MTGLRFLVTGALLGSACSPALAQQAGNGQAGNGQAGNGQAGNGQAGNGPAVDDDGDEGQILVTGLRSVTRDKLAEDAIKAPQSISIVGHQLMEHQATSRLEDALKNVPGITLNAGEGAARGDTVNLRGFPAYNDIFLDGVRDAAVYTRDSFNLETLEVLKGPSAVLFGRGSTGGAINQVSKAPTLAPLWSATVVGGTNSLIRATADVDQPIGKDAAIRINAMGEHSQVTDRDQVRNRRWGIAPSLSLGLGGRDTLTIEYLHQEQNDVPDVGIPIINGRPATVARNLDYGLVSDHFQANVNVATARYRHEFSSAVSISNTLRYADYTDTDVFNAPNFAYANSSGAPTAATPLAAVLVGRDSPSSIGHRTNLINQTDVVANFATGPVSHTLVAGLEFGREHDDTVRLVNPFGTAGETAATALLDPDPFEASVAQPGRTRAVTTAWSTAGYVIDTAHIGSKVDIIGGVRYDRFSAHYRPAALVSGVSPASLVPLDHVDTIWSPRASLVFKPTDHARFYASYGTSFDPSAEALSLSSKTANLSPVLAKSYEVGAKFDMLRGRLVATAALFRTQIDNAQVTDPDHPTQIVLAGNQRVDGLELGLSGHLTRKWEITAGYTHLNGKTLASSNAATVGKHLANVAPDAVNLWTEYEFSDQFELGIGGNYLGRRYADFAQSAALPGYVTVDAMAAWIVSRHFTVRVNVTNLFDKLAWANSYYASANENHVIPAPGRTALMTAMVKF